MAPLEIEDGTLLKGLNPPIGSNGFFDKLLNLFVLNFIDLLCLTSLHRSDRLPSPLDKFSSFIRG